MTAIGERIRHIREKSGMSKADFCKIIGVSPQYLRRIENGTRGLSVESLVNICQKTRVSADFILFGYPAFIDDLDLPEALSELSLEQIYIALDIIKRVATFINTDSGNELLIQEVLNKQGKTSL